MKEKIKNASFKMMDQFFGESTKDPDSLLDNFVDTLFLAKKASDSLAAEVLKQHDDARQLTDLETRFDEI